MVGVSELNNESRCSLPKIIKSNQSSLSIPHRIGFNHNGIIKIWDLIHDVQTYQ